MAKFKFSTKDCSYYMKKVIGAIFSFKRYTIILQPNICRDYKQKLQCSKVAVTVTPFTAKKI